RKRPHFWAVFQEACSRLVATAHTPDHDLVAAPFADSHIATAVSASISPIIVVTISPIIVVAIIVTTFTVDSLAAVGADAEFELSERDDRRGRDCITSLSGGCGKNPECARDGGDKRQFSHSNLLLFPVSKVNEKTTCLFVW